MLVALRVERFILMDALELRLEPGFNVLTGETGAGKSIVVGALELVLGGRAGPDLVRPGSKQACVEALFDLSESPALCARLEESGIRCDGELSIRRVLPSAGRSRAYLNGQLCTSRELAAIAPELADITSQHESVAMADARHHQEYLDRYAGLLDARGEVGVLVDELSAIDSEIRSIREAERSRSEREAFLRYQLEAIDALGPEPDELDALRAERGRLKHAERLRSIAAATAGRLESTDGGLCDVLGRLAAELARAAELDPTLAPDARELDECWGRLRDVAADVGRYAERVESDPTRLTQVQDRLFRLEQLLRTHGPAVQDLLDARERMRAELDELEGAPTRLPLLEQRRTDRFADAARLATTLSSHRRSAARKLSRAITEELGELGMGRARVVVDVSEATARDAAWAVGSARLGREGIDRVQFLIAPNEGLDPRPLARIASGGELSRSLLALKRALGGHANAPDAAKRGVGLEVFDEVDAGVGGATADRIGRSIADIARHRQVLCITHLAPIAAYADAHFVVTKHETAGQTTSVIERADDDRRVKELGRMIGGAEITTSTERAAGELLDEAQARLSARRAQGAASTRVRSRQGRRRS